jgi:membrane-associated phospholipid phosphatase
MPTFANTITLIVAFVCLVLLIALSIPVMCGMELPGDKQSLQIAMSLRNVVLTTVLSIPTFMASSIPAFLVCFALSILEWRRIQKYPARSFLYSVRCAGWPLYAFIFTLILNVGIRTTIRRLPPQVDYLPQLLPELQWFFQKYSFPSGHASSALVTYGAISTMLWKFQPYRWIGITILCLVIAGIGFRRPYLGVHWPSDVVAGFILGILCLSVSLYLSRRDISSNNA